MAGGQAPTIGAMLGAIAMPGAIAGFWAAERLISAKADTAKTGHEACKTHAGHHAGCVGRSQDAPS